MHVSTKLLRLKTHKKAKSSSHGTDSAHHYFAHIYDSCVRDAHRYRTIRNAQCTLKGPV